MHGSLFLVSQPPGLESHWMPKRVKAAVLAAGDPVAAMQGEPDVLEVRARR
jgi:hypothetical protein